MPLPGETLNLSPKTRERLGAELCQLINQLENDHSELLNSIEAWWDWYNAKPLTRTRTEPWPRASNIVVPMIKTTADAIAARTWGSMHTDKRTWEITSPNEDIEDLAHSAEEFLNQESRSTFDIMTPTHDWAVENTVIGSSVLAVQWAERHSWRWRPGGKKPQRVLLGRGPAIQHVPREQCLWERDRTIAESSVFVRQSLLNWNDLSLRVTTDGWDAEAVHASDRQSGIEGPTGRLLSAKREADGQNPGSGYADPHDIREVWIDYAMADLMTRSSGTVAPEFANPEDPRVPIVITLHKRTRAIFRAVAHPYFFDRWPFLDIYFRKQAGRGSSQGIAKILEHPQRGVTTLINQAIDAQTLNNSLKLATQNPRHKNLKFVPNQPIFVDNLQDILPLNMSQNVVPDVTLINLMISIGERVSGISDPNLGKETRLGGHPSPATNTLVQLQEGAKVLNASMRLIRKQLAQAGEWCLAMYQQFEGGDNGTLAQKFGQEDAERLNQVLIGPENFHFDLHSLSESVNPDVERNNAVLVTQMTANYYSQVLRILSGIIENPQTAQLPVTREAAVQAIKAYTKTYIRILRATDVDEAEQFALALRESRGQDAQLIQQFGGQLLDQLGGLTQQAEAGGAEGPVPGNGLADAIGGAFPGEAGPPQQAGSGFVL